MSRLFCGCFVACAGRVPYCVVYNGFSWTMTLSLYCLAIQFTSLPKAAVVCNICPLWIALTLHFFYHVNLSRWEIAGVVLSLLGLALTVLEGLISAQNSSNHEWLGDLLCLVYSIVNAISIFVGRDARKVTFFLFFFELSVLSFNSFFSSCHRLFLFHLTTVSMSVLLILTTLVSVPWEGLTEGGQTRSNCNKQTETGT